MASARFRDDQAATLADCGTVVVLVKDYDTRVWHLKKKKKEEEVNNTFFQPLTSNQMLPLPEVGDLGGVVVVDGVHPSVLQPVRGGHPSTLHLHGVHSGVLTELQHDQARHHLPSGERRIVGSIQLQRERPD